MKTDISRGLSTFALSMVLGAASALAQSPTPASVGTTSKPGIHGIPAVSTQPQSKGDSPILRKRPVHKTHTPTLQPLGLYYNPEHPGFLLDYNKLNADLYPLLSDQPHPPTADEKFWGTVAGVAGYSMAGAAAAQALGILPSDRKENKK